MVANFTHLIEATQLIEEGGPMKLVLGCRSRVDVPKELSIVVGGWRSGKYGEGSNGVKTYNRSEDRRRTEYVFEAEDGDGYMEDRRDHLGCSREKNSMLGGHREEGIAGSRSPTEERMDFPFLRETKLGISKGKESSTSLEGQRDSNGGKRARVDVDVHEGVELESHEGGSSRNTVQILNSKSVSDKREAHGPTFDWGAEKC